MSLVFGVLEVLQVLQVLEVLGVLPVPGSDRILFDSLLARPV